VVAGVSWNAIAAIQKDMPEVDALIGTNEVTGLSRFAKASKICARDNASILPRSEPECWLRRAITLTSKLPKAATILHILRDSAVSR